MLDLNALPLPDLFTELTSDGSLGRLLELARDEDLGRAGDVTTRSIIEPGRTADAAVTVREPGVMAGACAIEATLFAFQRSLEAEFSVTDGDAIDAGAVIAHLRGPLADMLTVERTILNLLGRLCGIATLTRDFVAAVHGTNAVICETRKTTPGMRGLEKYAVRCGGGTLHRLGLHDAMLFKDNHLAHIKLDHLAAALTDAITHARSEHTVRFVEVEVDSLEQLRTVLSIRRGLVDIILLDNMTPEELRNAVQMRNEMARDIQLEASGGVTLDTVQVVAETGVDRISVGALTHSVRCLDIALDIEPTG